MNIVQALVLELDGSSVTIKKDDLITVSLGANSEVTGWVVELNKDYVILDISAQYQSSFKNINWREIEGCEVVEPEEVQ